MNIHRNAAKNPRSADSFHTAIFLEIGLETVCKLLFFILKNSILAA
jgi:hypothetical protein